MFGKKIQSSAEGVWDSVLAQREEVCEMFVNFTAYHGLFAAPHSGLMTVLRIGTAAGGHV